MAAENGETPRKPWWRRWWAIVVWCFIGFIVLISVIAGISGDGESTSTVVSNQNQVQPSAPESPGTGQEPRPSADRDGETKFGNGVFEVGVDIAPGTYRSTGPTTAMPLCSYARLRSAGGGTTNLDNIIAIENVQGPAIVTVEPADGGFFSQGCEQWEKVQSSGANSADSGAPSGPRTSFDNGIFQVGVDIAPGTYRSEGPEPGGIFCSYMRLRDVGAGTSDLNNVIAIENVDGPAIVTIVASDGGFMSQSCLTWQKR